MEFLSIIIIISIIIGIAILPGKHFNNEAQKIQKELSINKLTNENQSEFLYYIYNEINKTRKYIQIIFTLFLLTIIIKIILLIPLIENYNNLMELF